jgi:hypothetical protein
MNYTVQAYETPDLIAMKLTGNRANAGALVAANPGKPRQIVDGKVTFAALQAGEQLALPAGWGGSKRGVAGLPQGVGASGSTNAASTAQGSTNAGPDGSPSTSGPVADGTAVALFAYLQQTPDQSSCTANQTVLAFQQSYNAANPSSPIGTDGLYGQATQSALQATLPNNTFPTNVVLCASAAAAPSSNGTPTPPAPSPAPATTTTTTSNTALYVAGGLAAVAAAVGIYVAVKHHHAMEALQPAARAPAHRRPIRRMRRRR